jgi:hypothetical protein
MIEIDIATGETINSAKDGGGEKAIRDLAKAITFELEHCAEQDRHTHGLRMSLAMLCACAKRYGVDL